MEIDPKFSVGPQPLLVEEGPPAQDMAGAPSFDAVFSNAEADGPDAWQFVEVDVLGDRLSEIVGGFRMDLPSDRAEAGRQVVGEVVRSLFDSEIFRELDQGEVAAGFHEYIQQDPLLQKEMDYLLDGLARRGQPDA